MSTNKSARQELERLYGAECFIEKLHLREEKTKRRYTSKGQIKRMQQLSYHHIKMRKDGGKATVENGALLSVENHRWFHKQSPEKQEELNRAFQNYKLGIAEITTSGVRQQRKIEIDMADCETIKLESNRETSKQRRARLKRETLRELEELEL